MRRSLSDAGVAALKPRAARYAFPDERNGLRAAREINRLLNAHILSAWGAREFVSIRRSDVAALLDQVEDENGARTADYILTVTRAIMNWHATRRVPCRPLTNGQLQHRKELNR